MNEEESRIIRTVDENGEEVEFEMIDMFEYQETSYALLLPLNEEEEDEESDEEMAVVMKVLKDGEEYNLEAIEDDEEFEKVVEFYQQMIEATE